MRVTKTVGEYLLGPGALRDIGQVLAERASSPNDRVVFLIDHFFKDGGLAAGLAASFTAADGA